MNKYLKTIICTVVLGIGLIGCKNDDSDSISIADLSTEITTYISDNYQNATILDAEYISGGNIEVDILDQNIHKEVIFNSQYSWLMTTWNVFPTTLPQTVLSTITTNYAQYIIDDVDFYETPTQSYYRIELEKAGSSDIVVNISEEGNVI